MVGVQRCGAGGIIAAKMLDVAKNGKDGAEGWGAGATEANKLTTDAILLSGEFEGNEGCGLYTGDQNTLR